MNYTDPAQFRQAAKIDFLKIRLPSSIRSERDAYEFSKHIQGGIKCARKWTGEGDNWITIHDASVGDLEFLLTHHPDAEILALEIAVDFFLRDGSSDQARLVSLYADLRHCLFPQKADALKNARRKYYDEQSSQIERDALRTQAGAGSIYWTDAAGAVQTRMYWKKYDNKQAVAQQSVRIESTFSRAGCQNEGLFAVADLPAFFSTLRKRCAPMMHVAEGIKPVPSRCQATTPEAIAKHQHESEKEQRKVARAWARYGSAWAAKHGYGVISDTVMNRVIGDALNNLQRSLSGLSCSTKKREHPGYDVLQTPANIGDRGLDGQGCIEGALPLSPSIGSAGAEALPVLSSLPSTHETETLVEVEAVPLVVSTLSVLPSESTGAGARVASVRARRSGQRAKRASDQPASIFQGANQAPCTIRRSLTHRPYGASTRSGRGPPAIPSLSDRLPRSTLTRLQFSQASTEAPTAPSKPLKVPHTP